jgi:hypothetical protein
MLNMSAHGFHKLLFGNANQFLVAILDKEQSKGFEFKGEAVTDKAYVGEGTALALRQQDKALAEKFNDANPCYPCQWHLRQDRE